jgi:hypothetical protein
LRMELRSILSPRVRIREGYRWSQDDEPITDAKRFRNAIAWEIVFDSDFTHSAIESIASSEYWRAALPDLLSQTTDLLQETMDLMKELGDATSKSDKSYLHQPSISRHAQNQNFHEWTALIELLREAWLAAARTAPEFARREIQRWAVIDYPIFRRFVFFALAEQPDIINFEQALVWLLADKHWWLWTSETQREVMRLLHSLGPQLSPEQSAKLQQAIVAGLPGEMVRDGVDPEQIQRIQARETWRRLSALKVADVLLTPQAQARLDELLAKHPQWGAPEESDEFPVWVGSDGSWRNFSKTPPSRSELEEWLIENADVNDLHDEDDFRERCRSDMSRVMTALMSLARRKIWPTDRWRQALLDWADEAYAKRAWRWLHSVFQQAPDNVFGNLASSVGYLLKTVSKNVGGRTGEFFVLVRRVLEASRNEVKESENDPLTSAINHPVGYVTEAVITWWYAQKLEDNMGIAEPVRAVFNEVCNRDVASFRHGRILLSTHVITLFRVDREWTASYVLPLFNWNNTEEAFSAWTGFLWSPRLYWPLLAALKDEFFQTVDHYEELERRGVQYVRLLTFSALEREEPFTVAEFAAATAKLPSAGLADAASVLTEGLQSAGDRRVEYWKNRVKPYLHAVWPNNQNARTKQVSTEFAELIIAAGDSFQDALQTLQDWIIPFDHTSLSLHSLHESGLATRFPEEALELLERLVPSQLQWSADALRDNLRQIRIAKPALMTDPRYARLDTIIRQNSIDP